MRNLKSWIAVILTLCLMMTGSAALAAALKLPKSTRVIEQEAFRGDKSLDEVKLQDGVQRIEARAFADSTVKSINLPKSVTFIDDSAFNNSKLTTVTATQGTYAYNWAVDHGYIKGNATPADAFFYDISNGKCTITGYIGSDTDVIIPSMIEGCSVTAIGYGAFKKDPNLTSVVIPDTVTSIGDSAFQDCSGLTSLNIPNGVTSIGEWAFFDCYGLTSVNIPASVTTIGDYAFCSCNSLTSIAIPNGVTRIGTSTFEFCKSLTSISLPASITSIADDAFDFCDKLKTVTATKGTYAYQWAVDKGYIIGDAPASPFEYTISSGKCTITKYTGTDTAVTIPAKIEGSSVTSIGTSAFKGCASLTSVSIPASVTSIGASAFSGCTGLKNITLPNALKTIGKSAFYNCTGLKSIALPDSLTSIGDNAFNGCKNLTTVTATKGTYAYQWAVDKGYIKEDESSDCDFEYTIVDGKCTITKYIGTETTVQVPNKINGYDVASVGSDVFDGCTIENIVFQEGIIKIDEYALSGCGGLKSVTIPYSFKGPFIKGVLGSTVDTIYTPENSYTYRVWWGLEGHNVIAIEGPVITGDYDYVIVDGECQITWYLGTDCDVIIPEKIDGYRVTSIGDGAFAYSGIESIAIPDSVNSIGELAFQHCYSLKSITIPYGVTSIGERTFENCYELNSVIIPKSVTSIGDFAFYFCQKLNGIAIPDSVTSLGYVAFAYCEGLKSIMIPNSLTELEGNPFLNCRGLISITIPNSVNKISDWAFNGCDNIKTVYGQSGTYAETWAKQNGYTFVAVKD